MHDIFTDIASMQKNIQPLNMNGLRGRVLRLPSESKKYDREILLVYGHHSSLERMYGFAEALSTRGNVTMPDLPGFGGMDSFYTIGMKPTLDTMADYLATFVKLKYRRKKVTIVGMSYGFIVVTRMLQRYPDLAKRVDILISLVGFAHSSDFRFTAKRMLLYRTLTRTFSYRLPAFIFYNVALHPTVIKTAYKHTYNAKHKFQNLDPDVEKQMLGFEVVLWCTNDLRTHAYTNHSMLVLDNCSKQVDLPVHHIAVKNDQYFDNAVVEQHMRIIFSDFIEYPISVEAHAPSIVANKKAAQPFIPKKLRTLLST